MISQNTQYLPINQTYWQILVNYFQNNMLYYLHRFADSAKLRRRNNTVMANLDYIQTLINQGRWSFSSTEMTDYLGFSSKDKLRILRKNERIISPIRGFYVIVPEEYLNTDRLPVERFIDAMMCYSEHPYYVGLLSASSFYGASHQSPQSFQIITNIDKRNITIGRNQLLFYRKRNTSEIPILKRKTTTGYFNISTPESTLFDLVEFQKQVGGLEQVGLIAMELSEKLNMTSLVETAEYYPNPIIQRVGYLLDVVGLEDLSDNLAGFIRTTNPVYSFLNPSESRERTNQNARWKLSSLFGRTVLLFRRLSSLFGRLVLWKSDNLADI